MHASGVLGHLYVSYYPTADGVVPHLISSSLPSRRHESAYMKLLRDGVQVAWTTSPDPEFLFGLLTDDIVLLLRLNPIPDGGLHRDANVLVGHRSDLTPDLALSAIHAFPWLVSRPHPGSSIEGIMPTALLHASADAKRRPATQQETQLIDALLPTLHAFPAAQLTVVGCPAECRTGVLRGLREAVDEPRRHARSWTFSTHESVLTPSSRLPEIIMLSQWLPPDSPAMLRRHVINLDDDTPISPGTHAPRRTRRTRREATGSRPGSEPHQPAGSSTGPPRPVGWYGEPEQPEQHPGDGGAWTGRRWAPPSGVFVSYARRDQITVSTIVADLRAAQLPVWLDQEIETGRQWWEQIIGQIQRAGVLLHVVSADSLASEPCTSERGYAEALGVPVVSVLVGEADLRSSPYGNHQVVDYRQADRLQAVRLVADVMRALQQRTALPSPLPPPPAVPFHYLLTLADQLRAPHLSRDEQLQLLDDIVERRRTTRDPSALERLDGLLRELADRPDALYSVASVARQTAGEQVG